MSLVKCVQARKSGIGYSLLASVHGGGGKCPNMNGANFAIFYSSWNLHCEDKKKKNGAKVLYSLFSFIKRVWCFSVVIVKMPFAT
jgi:hypothetical protein